MQVNSSDGSPSVVFKLRALKFILSVTCLIVCVFAFLSALVMRQESVMKGALLLVGTTAPFIIAGVVFLLGKSDIVISQQRISRRFIGKELQGMKWSGISIIRVFPMGRGPRGKNLIGVNLISSLPHRGILSRKIWFGEDPDDIHELIAVLNQYITEYKIIVERTVSGITSHSACI